MTEDSATALIHVVDDDDGFRDALLSLLDAAGFEARGYATAGDFLLDEPPSRPGCLLLDLHMPGPSGLELQAALERMGSALPVVFMTGRGDVTSSVAAMKAGAVDFLEKPVSRDALFDAIDRALALDARLSVAREEAQELQARFAALTPRERQVLDSVVAGRLNKQIASDLGIVERTVKLIRAQVMAKVGARSVAELSRLAERYERRLQA